LEKERLIKQNARQDATFGQNSTTKTVRHDIAEILLKVTLKKK
jgi:hypothetical protein